MATDIRKWSRRLLAEALELEPDRRASFLDEKCAGQPQVRVVLDQLIEAHDRAEATLTLSEQGVRQRAEAMSPSYGPGARIGHFVIREFIQEGSFGEVYVADQVGEIKRRVAMKILKSGLDGNHVVARFELERQILALVDHPNIAKIFDAGTTPSGRPYFAMEYINGVPITVHCDKHRLGIEARLVLFAQVCDALQHAHQKGIIHRDVKPSNVLVAYEDEKAVPKIIDFGVAKAMNRPLTDRTIYTNVGQVVGTLAYMSPEQARLTVQDIDTRSDVYSLGVLLYELLTGLKPLDEETFSEAAFDEKLRLIREAEPARPSTKLITGSNSVDTAGNAHRRSTNLSTLSRRLRGDLDWITMCALEKERSRRYASASEFAADVRRYLANEPVSVGAPTVRYRLRKFVRRHRTGVAAGVAIAAVVLIGTVATTSSIVARSRAETELGRSQARDLVEQAKLLTYQYPDQAWELLQQASAKDARNQDARLQIARVLWRRGQADEALTRVEAVFEEHPRSGKAAALLAGLTVVADPERSARYRAAAEQLLEGAALHFALGIAEPDAEKAIEHYSAALDLNPWMFDALWERAVRQSDPEAAARDADLAARVRPDQPITHVLRGAALINKGQPGEAVEVLTRAIDMGGDWIARFNRGLAYAKAGKFERALVDYDAGLADAPDEIRLHRERGYALQDLGRFSEAADAARKVIELGDRRADAYWDLAERSLNAGRMEEAEQAYTTVIDHWPQDRGEDHAYLLTDRGHARMRLGRHEEAERDLRRAVELDANNPKARLNLCQAMWRQSRYAESVASCEKAVDLVPDRPLYALQRGMAYWFTGRLDEALRDVQAYVASGEADADWVLFWEWTLHRLLGDMRAAGQTLDRAAAVENPSVRKTASYLRDAGATGRPLDAIAPQRDRFLATVFAGLRDFVDSGPDPAGPRLEEALQMGFPDMLEYDIAQWALAQR